MPYRLTPVAVAMLAVNVLLLGLIASWFPRGLDRRRLAADAALAPRLYFEGEAEQAQAGKGANPRIPMAVDAWQRALKRRPAYVAARLGIAKCRLDEGAWEQARKEYEAALSARGATPRERAAAGTGLGIALLQLSEHADAARAGEIAGKAWEAIEQAARVEGANLPDPCVSLAAGYLRSGNAKDAKSWLDEAERRMASVPLSKESIPSYLLSRGILSGGEAALADWRAVLEIDPALEAAHRNLDQSAIPRLAKAEGDTAADEKTVEALPYVKAFLEGKPADPVTKPNLVAAVCALGLHAFREGRRALEEAGRSANSPEAAEWDGKAFDRFQAAVRRFDEGMRLAPERSDFLRNRTAAATWMERAARCVVARGGEKAAAAKGAAEEGARLRLEGLERIVEAAKAAAGGSPGAAAEAQSLGLTIAALRLASGNRAGAAEAAKALPDAADPEVLRLRGILAYLDGRHAEARDLWKTARALLSKGQPKTWTHPEFDPVTKAMGEKPYAGPVAFVGVRAGPASDVFGTTVAFHAAVRNRAAAVPLEASNIEATLDGKPVEFVLTTRHVYSRPVSNLGHGKHRARIRVRDALGNEASTSGEFLVDAKPPRLAFRMPEPDARFDAKTAKFYNTGTIPIGFTIADDDLPIDRASISCRVAPQPEKGPSPPPWVLVENGVMKRKGQVSIPPLDQPLPIDGSNPNTAKMQFEPQRHLMVWGTYTIHVSAKDLLGNAFEDSWSFQVFGRSPTPVPEPPKPPEPGPGAPANP